MAGNTGIGKMHMELYTNNAPLTQKANFWCNFVSSLKGERLNKTINGHATSTYICGHFA